jgi:hypothetical protein
LVISSRKSEKSYLLSGVHMLHFAGICKFSNRMNHIFISWAPDILEELISSPLKVDNIIFLYEAGNRLFGIIATRVVTNLIWRHDLDVRSVKFCTCLLNFANEIAFNHFLSAFNSLLHIVSCESKSSIVIVPIDFFNLNWV